MLKASFYKEVDYVDDIINAPYTYGLYPFGRFIISYNINNVSIKRSMQETSSFSFDIPINEIFDTFPLTNSSFVLCAVERDGELLCEGFVSEWTKTEDSVSIECEDLMILLTYNRPVTYPYYDSQQKVSLIYQIIKNKDYTDNHGKIQMRLGEFFTLEDPLEVVTIDLREETQAYAQVKKFIDQTPDVYIRYGGSHKRHVGTNQVDGWTRTYDLGKFDYKHHFTYDDSNILDVTVSKQNEVPLLHITPFGETFTDDMGDEQILDISYLQYHVDYPAILDPDYEVNLVPGDLEFGVRDTTRVAQFVTDSEPYQRATKYYGITTRSTDNPSNEALARAALRLYKSAIKDLKNTKVNEIELKLTSNVYPEKIMPGNIITVRYNYFKNNYNILVDNLTYSKIDQFTLQEDLYVVSYQIDIGESEDKISYVLNRSGVYKDISPEKTRKTFDKDLKINKNFKIEFTPTDAWAYYEISLPTGTAPTTTASGFDAYGFTLDTNVDLDFGDLDASYLPAIGATPLRNWYYDCDRKDIIVESDIVLGGKTYGDNVTLKVRLENADWDTDQKVTIKFLFEFNTV